MNWNRNLQPIKRKCPDAHGQAFERLVMWANESKSRAKACQTKVSNVRDILARTRESNSRQLASNVRSAVTLILEIMESKFEEMQPIRRAAIDMHMNRRKQMLCHHTSSAMVSQLDGRYVQAKGDWCIS
jgi:hypothetical protein